jgi:hypothetical protein
MRGTPSCAAQLLAWTALPAGARVAWQCIDLSLPLHAAILGDPVLFSSPIAAILSGVQQFTSKRVILRE